MTDPECTDEEIRRDELVCLDEMDPETEQGVKQKGEESEAERELLGTLASAELLWLVLVRELGGGRVVGRVGGGGLSRPTGRQQACSAEAQREQQCRGQYRHRKRRDEERSRISFVPVRRT